MIVLELTMVDESLDPDLDQPVLLVGTEFKIYEQHKKRGDCERTVTIIHTSSPTNSFTQVAESFRDIDTMIINDRSPVGGS